MKIYFISILFASLIFLIVDLIWLNYSVKNFYRPNLGSLLNEKPIMWAAILFYLIYVFGLAIIIIKPALFNDSISLAFWSGLVFGLVAYGTYNLTNMATITNWSSKVVFVDMLWGALLTGFSCSTAIFMAKKLFS